METMIASDQQELVNLYRMENRAMVSRDVATLNRILAPGMQLVHMTGYVQPKLEWIDQIQNGDMHYFSSTEDRIKDVQIDGNRASLIGQNQVRASVWGSAVATWPLQMRVEYEKDNGKWLIVKQEASTY